MEAGTADTAMESGAPDSGTPPDTTATGPDAPRDAAAPEAGCTTGASKPCYTGPASTKSVGACKAGADICPCKTDQDCVGKDDGDICNGTLYCAKAGAGSVCKLNPATQLHCATVDDTACVANLYQLKNRLAK